MINGHSCAASHPINVLHYEKWKNTDAVETMVFFLDAVISEFVEKLEQYQQSNDLDDKQTFLFMQRAYNFAKQHRALGLGVLGWHSLTIKNVII